MHTFEQGILYPIAHTFRQGPHYPSAHPTRQGALYEHEVNEEVRVLGMTANIDKITITGANLWTKASVAQFDAKWAGEADANRSWLIMVVHISATVTVQQCNPSGEALPSVPMHKTGSWLFLRGPLPRGFSQSVTAPWRIVGWC